MMRHSTWCIPLMNEFHKESYFLQKKKRECLTSTWIVNFGHLDWNRSRLRYFRCYHLSVKQWVATYSAGILIVFVYIFYSFNCCTAPIKTDHIEFHQQTWSDSQSFNRSQQLPLDKPMGFAYVFRLLSIFFSLMSIVFLVDIDSKTMAWQLCRSNKCVSAQIRSS